MKHVKRETGVNISTEDASAVNTQLARIAKTADITEVTFRIMEVVKIFQQNIKEDSSKRYRSPEEAVLYVEYEVVKYLMDKANNEHWMTLSMSSDPCRFGHTTSSFAESYNNSINYARRSCLGNAIVSIVNKEEKKITRCLMDMEHQAQFPHTTALSCVDDEFVQALYTEYDRYRYVKNDGTY